MYYEYLTTRVTIGAAGEMMSIAPMLQLAFASKSQPEIKCATSSSIAMKCSWTPSHDTGTYHVTLSDPADGGMATPFAIQTTTDSSIYIDDLRPGMTYAVGVRAHPKDAPSFVWGWTDYAAPVTVRTPPSPPGAPHSLHRLLPTPHPTEIALRWLDANETLAHEVGVARAPHEAALDLAAAGEAPLQWAWHEAGASSKHTLRGLVPGSTYLIRVRAGAAVSDAAVFHTARGDGVLYTTAYRISEYQLAAMLTFTVDFLHNHDAASLSAMPVYIMDKNPITTASVSPRWDECQARLPSILPGRAGTGLTCLDYAYAHKYAEVAAVCGNFSNADDKLGWDVHWYCGTGWPESVVMSSPITEHCVEHATADADTCATGAAVERALLGARTASAWSVAADGYADYLSCNGDEVDPWGNQPRDPTCICNVWMDRMIGQQPRHRIEAQCGLLGQPGTATEPFVGNEVQCNCSRGDPRGGVYLEPEDLSNTYVGRAPVMLPYLFYTKFEEDPYEHYPVSRPDGYNYVFPKGGACAEGAPPVLPPAAGCRWSRRASSRVFWGGDLQAAGWDFSWAQDTPDNMTHSLRNIARFERLVNSSGAAALSKAGRFLTPRCCGC